MATTGQKLLAAGTALLIAEPALALAHTGGVGVIVGLAVGAIAYNAVEDVEKATGRELPLPVAKQSTSRAPREHSLAYRLLNGKSTRGAMADEHTEDEDEEGEPEANLSPQIRADGMIDLAPDVQLPPGDIIGKSVLIAGMRRSGKTTLGARLAEEIGKFDIPLFIPCREGDYLSLADVLPHAVIAGHPSTDTQYKQYDFARITLDMGEKGYVLKPAMHLGYDTLRYGYQVILDLASYPSLEEAIMVQVGIIRGMVTFTERNPELRTPSYVYLDEAQMYLPQALSDSLVGDPTIRTALLTAYANILGIGGKRGIASVTLTQRIAQCNNKIIAQPEICFLLRQTFDTDVERSMNFINKETATPKQIKTFKNGQGVFIGADGTQKVTQFSPRRSDSTRSHTPKVETTQRFARSGHHFQPTSQASDVATSLSTSIAPSQAQHEEVEGNGATGPGKRSEVVQPLPQLSELEMQVGRMFFQDKTKPKLSDIIKELYPDVSGGNPYIRATTEVNEALRRYAEYMQHRSLQAVREEGSV